jgi:methylmalonyl-CoA/ethylmalonyl-CoA epimerase
MLPGRIGLPPRRRVSLRKDTRCDGARSSHRVPRGSVSCGAPAYPAPHMEAHVPQPLDLPAPLSGLGRVHHVAVVVADLDRALGFYRDVLGLPVELVLPIESDRVAIAFLPVGESKVELVQPTDDTTGVARFLASRGEGFHHVCFEVPDVARALADLERSGVQLIDRAPRPGAEGPVAFLHPLSAHGVLVELIEAAGGPAWSALGIEPLAALAGDAGAQGGSSAR